MSAVCVCAQPPIPPGGAEVPSGAGSKPCAHARQPYRVRLFVEDPETGETWWAELEHKGQPVPVDVLFARLLKTGLRSHALATVDYGIQPPPGAAGASSND